jgi:hypothetical protein
MIHLLHPNELVSQRRLPNAEAAKLFQSDRGIIAFLWKQQKLPLDSAIFVLDHEQERFILEALE